MKSRQGQSTLEYLLVVTAVIVVAILFTTNRNAGIQNRLSTVYNQTTQDMMTYSWRLNPNAPRGTVTITNTPINGGDFPDTPPVVSDKPVVLNQ